MYLSLKSSYGKEKFLRFNWRITRVRGWSNENRVFETNGEALDTWWDPSLRRVTLFFLLIWDVVLLTTETWVLLNFSRHAGNFLLFLWGILVWTGIAMTKRSLRGCLWAVSKTRLLLYHVSLVSAANLGAFWNYGVGWSSQRYSSGEVPLTPLGTNGWTNIFCCLKCWDVCMGLELPPSRPNSYLFCSALYQWMSLYSYLLPADPTLL